MSDAGFELIAFLPTCAALVGDTQYAGAPLHILNATFHHRVSHSRAFPPISSSLFFFRLLMICDCSNLRPRGPSVRSRKTDCKVGSILNARIGCPLVYPKVASIII